MQLFITKYQVTQVENSLGFTYQFNNRNGKDMKFSSLFNNFGIHEPIPLEIVASVNMLALSYCLSYVVDSDKEALRSVYANSILAEILIDVPEIFKQAVELAKIYTKQQESTLGASREFFTRSINNLKILSYETLQKHKQELNYLRKTINSKWFINNGHGCLDPNSLLQGSIYTEAPKRRDYLETKIPQLDKLCTISPLILSLLEQDFDTYESYPSSEGIPYKLLEYLKTKVIDYLKSLRNEEVELYMNNVEIERFRKDQIFSGVNYLDRYKNLSTGNITDKLFVKKTPKTLRIFIIPDNFDGNLKNKGVIEVFGKINNTIYGWLYKGWWNELVENTAQKLQAQRDLSNSIAANKSMADALNTIKNTLDILERSEMKCNK